MTAAFGALSAVNWRLLPVLTVLAALHYLFSAIALRAAAGLRLPLRRTMLTQFTAAAASRFTPGGLGGTAVNLRYLTVHGATLPCAATAIAAQHASLWLAELLVLLAVIWLTGDTQALTAIGDHVTHLAASATRPAVALCLVGALGLFTAWAWFSARRARRRERSGRTVHDWIATVRDLCDRPRDLMILMSASAGVALVLGLAFGLSVLAVPGASTPAHLGVLFGAYIVGSAAGSAIPTPGGIGTAEAAFIAALIGVGIAAAPALQAVLLFRAITFWAPVPIGLLAVRLSTAR